MVVNLRTAKATQEGLAREIKLLASLDPRRVKSPRIIISTSLVHSIAAITMRMKADGNSE